ncbi:response regulator transcription factor [Sediminispirochaeta smaragdinae]|uniref:Two component transcriptional regulator, winged helix family n=1 Tax=Sediminispirochaeta smaragdinae (strain DSM 11293 / JCM 15392 / SEBR 4228) TaxID=573413 RepID=E1R483_SEDSS|nr:response regulator transcription factor [Sediminispirochaeta smaragdinae]ADK80505.1 two component transcriptional regulator, winged helix family [Sediminispirochaeta smaragdinae DSM 11293]
MKTKILIVEDEPYTGAQMKQALGHPLLGESEVSLAPDGKTALHLLSETFFDLVLLDVVLPDIDGFKIAKELKERKIPFFMISSRDLPSDAILGFQAGAEDYLRKPVDSEELAVRVTHFLSRNTLFDGKQEGTLRLGQWTIDMKQQRVRIDQTDAPLTPIELKLLLLLAKRAGSYTSTEELAEGLWPEAPPNDLALAVRVHVRRLRTKLEQDPKAPRYIINKWGAGYRLHIEQES